MAIGDLHNAVLNASGESLRPTTGNAWLVVGVLPNLDGLHFTDGTTDVDISGDLLDHGKIVVTNALYLEWDSGASFITYVEVPGS